MKENDDFEKIINEVIKTARKGIMTLGDLMSQAKAIFGEAFQFQNEKEIEDAIKIAWNYEEQNTYQYNLVDAIKWFKMNLDKEKKYNGCLLRRKEKDSIVLHLCFLDELKQPLLEPGHKHKVVHCKVLDESLEKQFGDKDMLVFG